MWNADVGLVNDPSRWYTAANSMGCGFTTERQPTKQDCEEE